MANRKKKFHLSEIDLGLAATAAADRKKSIVRRATGGDGYDRYRGVRSNLGSILNTELPLLSGPTVTREMTRDIVGRACNNGPGEVDGNEGIAVGLWDYVKDHNVTAANLDLERVALGPAGRRQFWAPYILKIDGKKYIPFFDLRGRTKLTPDARRFVFSVNHTHIRLANPTEYGDVGLVIFQFGPLEEADPQKGKTRKAIAHFDKGIVLWSDQDIGKMIDDVYRALDEIRKAA
jgi:hypothetical protein